MNPLRDGCDCAACGALRTALAGPSGVPDIHLVGLYGKKLLYHGWAGKLTAEEKAYRRAHSVLARNAAERGARIIQQVSQKRALRRRATLPLKVVVDAKSFAAPRERVG